MQQPLKHKQLATNSIEAAVQVVESIGTPIPPNDSQRLFVSYKRAQNWLREADLLLIRAPGIVSWAGRGVHWHAATVSRWGTDWFALETRPSGGRAVPISALVERNPRQIDVFRPNPDGRWPEYRPELAVALMRRIVALRYGWASVFKAAAARIPFARYLFAERYFDDDAPRTFPQTFALDDENDVFFNSKTNNASKLAAETDAAQTDAPGNADRQSRLFYANIVEREELEKVVKRWRKAFPKTTLQCAEARALADRRAGVDPVPFLNDRFVEPADLARSPFYRYQFSFDSLES